MAFNVNTFRQEMKFDGARANLFEVSVNFPFGLGDQGLNRDLVFKAKSAQIPGSTLGMVPVQYFGREVKFAGNRTFADWTITVLNDEDFKIRGAFENWMSGINSHGGNLRTLGASPNSYTVDGKVKHYGKTGNVEREYVFRGLFPTDLSPIDLDWGNNDAIEEYTVTFSYQWWEAVNNNSKSARVV